MVDKHRVTYDSPKEDAFLVHSDDGIAKFSRSLELSIRSYHYAFFVHTDGGIAKFSRSLEGLYSFQSSFQFLEEVAYITFLSPPVREYHEDLSNLANSVAEEQNDDEHLVSTVAENRKHYTECQFQCTKESRRFYHTMGCPGNRHFKNIIR